MQKLLLLALLLSTYTSLFSQMGIIDETGKTIIPFEYSRISEISDTPLLLTTKDGKQGIINEKGELILPNKYDKISVLKNTNLFISSVGNKKSIIDFSGKLIVDADTYTELKTFSGKFFYGYKREIGGFIFNLNGDTLQQKMHPKLKFLSDSIFMNSSYSSTTLYNISSSIPFEKYPYRIVSQIGNNSYCAVQKAKYGIVDSTMKSITPFIYEREIHKSNDDIYVGKLDKHTYHILDYKGKILKELAGFDYVGYFREGYCNFKKDNLNGMLNSAGEIVIPAVYNSIRYLFNEKFLVKKDNKRGVINSKNELITPIVYNQLTLVEEKENKENPLMPLATFSREGQGGFFNSNYEEKILGSDDEIKNISTFSDFLLIKNTDGTTVLKNISLEDLFTYPKETILSQITPTGNIFSIKNQRYGLVNKQNKTILPFLFKSMRSYRIKGQYVAILDNPGLLLNQKKQGDCTFQIKETSKYNQSFDLRFVTDENEMTFKNALHLTETTTNYLLYTEETGGLLPNHTSLSLKKKDTNFENLLAEEIKNEVFLIGETENLVCENVQLAETFKDKYPEKHKEEIQFKIVSNNYDGTDLHLRINVKNVSKNPITLCKSSGLDNISDAKKIIKFPSILRAKILGEHDEKIICPEFVDYAEDVELILEKPAAVIISPKEEKEFSVKLNLSKVAFCDDVAFVDVIFVYDVADKFFTKRFINDFNKNRILTAFGSVEEYEVYLSKLYKRKIESEVIRVNL